MRAGRSRGARARRLAAPVLLLVLAAAWFAWSASRGVLGYTPPVRGVAPEGETDLGWPWHGAVHVHTVVSGDASGTVGEITAAAKRLGLDFVVISDHTRAGRSEEPRRPRWVDGVLVVFAEEASIDDGHLLVLGTPGHRYSIRPTTRQAVRDIRALGGHPIAAHPVGAASPWSAGLSALDGLEIPNASAALDRLLGGPWSRVAAAALAYPASAAATLLIALAETPSSTALWDDLTASTAIPWPRPLSIVGAADAHGPRVLGMPTYEQALDAITMTVWLERSPAIAAVRPREAAAMVQAALANGRSATVVRAAGRAPGFVFTARELGMLDGVAANVSPGASLYGPGDLAAIDDKEWVFAAGLGAPGNYRIELVRDGVPVASRDGDSLLYATAEPGTYRVQVYRTEGPAGAGREGNLPWIMSNPIYLWPRHVIDLTRRFPTPPLPGPPISFSLLAEPGWAAEADALSFSAMGSLDPGLRWQFRIPRQEEPDAHSALAWRPEPAADWSEYPGLSFRFATETEWRMALHLWTRAVDGGITTWDHIVAARPPQSSSGVVWSSCRRLGSGDVGVVDGQLSASDLSSVVGVTLLVTPYIVRPGTDSTIDLLEFGLFGGPAAAAQPLDGQALEEAAVQQPEAAQQ